MTNKRYKNEITVGNTIGDYIICEIIKNKVNCQCKHCLDKFTFLLSDMEFGHHVYCKSCNRRNKNKGIRQSKLYNIWREMNRRCYSKNCNNYKKYGMNNIEVYEKWKRKCDGNVEDGYKNFYEWAIENGYKDGLTIDRKNPYENYTPENCRWVSYYEQNTNLKMNKLNKSGYLGIGWYDRKGQTGWRSRIKVNGKEIILGIFSNKKDAVDARNNYITDNNLPHKIQKWIGEIGYNKDNFELVYAE